RVQQHCVIMGLLQSGLRLGSVVRGIELERLFGQRGGKRTLALLGRMDHEQAFALQRSKSRRLFARRIRLTAVGIGTGMFLHHGLSSHGALPTSGPGRGTWVGPQSLTV